MWNWNFTNRQGKMFLGSVTKAERSLCRPRHWKIRRQFFCSRHIFRSLTLPGIPLGRMKTFPRQKNIIFFPKFKLLCFLQKPSSQVQADSIMKKYHLILILQQILNLFQFWENSSFSPKNPWFFLIKPNFVSFEKSYYFSQVLRRICYNLVIKKFHCQNRRTSDTFKPDITIAKNIRKTCSLWEDDFPSIIKYERKILWRLLCNTYYLLVVHRKFFDGSFAKEKWKSVDFETYK